MSINQLYRPVTASTLEATWTLSLHYLRRLMGGINVNTCCKR